MPEGTVPVPPNGPCAQRDEDVVPFRELQDLSWNCITFSGVIAGGEPRRRG
jgi:hypothetical protein